jgi:hypothetical protein
VTVAQIARVCHEVNRAYCTAIGDDSQPSWEDAPEWQKDSAIAGVESHISSPMSPQESHAAWSKHKILDGWTWGEVKDADAKTHPCLVPYDQLPLSQRIKDYLFGAVVASLKVTA